MHVTRLHAQPPERAGAQFVRGIRRSRSLNDAVARPYIVQEEIAEGGNDLASQGLGYRKDPAIHHGSSGSCCYGSNVAGAALKLFEKVQTLPGVGRRRQNGVTRRNPGAPDELRKVVNIR